MSEIRQLEEIKRVELQLAKLLIHAHYANPYNPIATAFLAFEHELDETLRILVWNEYLNNTFREKEEEAQ